MNAIEKDKGHFAASSTGRPTPGRFKRFVILILSLAIVGSAVALSLFAWDANERHPRTDDGVARANAIGIAPRVSGPIIRINVSDNQFVKGGDLLFEIQRIRRSLLVEESLQLAPRVQLRRVRL